MSFNHLPPVNSNQPNFFARQGSRLLSQAPSSLTNLDELPNAPAFNVNPAVKTTPKSITKLPSLSNLDQFDRPGMFMRKEEGTPKAKNPFEPQFTPGFMPVMPQGNGLLRLPQNNSSNKKVNSSHDVIAQNMYGFQSPSKNASFSEGGTPKSYDSSSLLRPLIQPRMANNPMPYGYPPQMMPNINPGPYGRPYNLFSGNRSLESMFEKRLEQQHKLLDKLLVGLGKEIEGDLDESPNGRDSGRSKSLVKSMDSRRSNKKYTVPGKQRILRIDEKAESEENSPNLKLRSNRKGARTGRQNESIQNSIDEALMSDGSPGELSNRHGKGKKDKHNSKSLNDLDKGLMSKKKLLKGKDQNNESSGEENSASKPFDRKGDAKGTKRIKTNIMGSDEDGGVIFMSRRGRKDLAQARLRITGWCLVYYRLLYNRVKTKVLDERENFLRTISENIFALNGIIEAYILQIAGKQIQEMINNRSYDFIFVSNKVQVEKKLDKECEALFIHYKNILDRLFTFTKTLPPHLFGLLASLSEEGSQIPHDYFSEFEIKRQQFTYFGKLKYMTAAKSKLIIGGIILRILVHQVIMKPWDVFKVEAEKFDKERLLNIGSLLYNVIIEVLKGMVPIFHNNQAFLSVELKVKAKKDLLEALDLSETEQKFNIQKEATRDGEIIEGFYSKQQLDCFFTDRKKYVDDLKALVYGWLDCIYESSHEEALNQNQKKKE